MSKFITEMLSEINENPDAIVKYKDNAALKLTLEHAFNPEKKFVLPEGDPPYKEDAAPLGMSPGNFLMEMRRLYVLCRKDLPALKRETIFIEMLESFHPSESKVLLAVKDQNLTSLYKNVTHKLAFDNGMVAVAPVEKVKKERKKSVKTGQNDSQEEELNENQA